MNHERNSIPIDLLVRTAWNKIISFADPLIRNADLDPNILSATGGALGLASAYFTSKGEFSKALLLLCTSGIFDASDGYVARLNGRETKFGECLDSIIDRIVDIAMIEAMAIYSQSHGWVRVFEIANISRGLARIPAHLRVVAEGYGVPVPEQSFGSRLPRTIAVGVSLAIPYEHVWASTMGYLAVASGLTSAQRILALLTPNEQAMFAGYNDPEIIKRLYDIFIPLTLSTTMKNDRDRLAMDVLGVVQYSVDKYEKIEGFLG